MPIFIPPQPLAQTSDVTSFNPTTYEVIKAALRGVGAYASTDQPRPEQIEDALFALNVMLKSWQVDGFLWLQEFITVDMVAAQESYQIGPNSGDTVLDANGAAYTQRPTKVFTASRRDSTGYEIPMMSISRADYAALPNKTASGSPVQYYYDPQLGEGRLYVWPSPSNSTDKVVLTVDRNLQDMVSDINTFDMPREWIEVVISGLKCRLAAEYGLALGERQLLDKEFVMLKESILAYNRENTSVFYQPGRW